ncbi:MAG: hypothetical protein QXT22_02050 [Candidatus Hadarchaeales archaeon]
MSRKTSAGEVVLIVYDVRRADDRVRLKVNRELHRARAVMLQHSVWESGELKKLRGLAALIKSSGGRAIVLKKIVVYR